MSFAPRLLPDEWAVGYWGRVLVLNGLDDRAALRRKQAFAIHFCEERGIQFTGVDRLLATVSAAARVPSEQVLLAHTLVPLDGAASEITNGDWFDDRYEARSLRLRTVQDFFKCGALCPRCAEEDLAFWGFSYWRRSHQIPGALWCQKHLCHLRHTVGPMISQALPHQAARQEIDSDDEAVAAASCEGKTIHRYVEICSELLQRPKPFSRLQMLNAIAARARLVGLRTDRKSSGSSLYDYAASRLPGAWLRRNVRRDVFNDVLRRFYTVPRAIDYALALAVLYDSPDDAFVDVGRPLPTTETLIRKINIVVDQHAPKVVPLSRREILDRRMRLLSAVEGILHGEDVTTAFKRTRCPEQVIESALLECFAGIAMPVAKARAVSST